LFFAYSIEMSERKIGINDKIGIYLTSDEIEHIRIALGMYSTRLLNESKKDKEEWADDDWREVVKLKRIIHQPWKSDRLVLPKPTS